MSVRGGIGALNGVAYRHAVNSMQHGAATLVHEVARSDMDHCVGTRAVICLYDVRPDELPRRRVLSGRGTGRWKHQPRCRTFSVVGFIGDPGRIRTCDPQIRNLMLYPTELRGRCFTLLHWSLVERQSVCRGLGAPHADDVTQLKVRLAT